jgi:GcrA cell cycle regulator
MKSTKRSANQAAVTLGIKRFPGLPSASWGKPKKQIQAGRATLVTESTDKVVWSQRKTTFRAADLLTGVYVVSTRHFVGPVKDSDSALDPGAVAMNWTDERVELLKKLWADGLSASQIAAQLGGVSRNAVIGKVHRLKLSSRGRATASPARQKKTQQASSSVKSASRAATVSRSMTTSIGATALQAQFDAEPVARQMLRPVENVVVPISRRLQLIQLNERTCKWPNGDPLSEDFHFCGNDSAETGPYCNYHSRIAFQPASERRRSR